MVYLTIEITEEKITLSLNDVRMMQVCWRAEFKSFYIEEISRKTGKPITYQQFLVLLDSSLSG